jgi:hypothetical protein
MKLVCVIAVYTIRMLFDAIVVLARCVMSESASLCRSVGCVALCTVHIVKQKRYVILVSYCSNIIAYAGARGCAVG